MMNLSLFPFILILLSILTFFHCQNINQNAYYRIDSLYNGYSITIKDQIVKMRNKRKGDCQNFIFIPKENNSYYIESRIDKKRLGVNDQNEVITYTKEDNQNEKKTVWIIESFSSPYNTKNDQFIIKNEYNLKYLEINEFNDTTYFLNCTSNNYIESQYFKAVFSFVKIFEIINIKDEHLKIIEDEPIDIVIKYIDLTDSSLVRKGIPQIKKDKDNEELRYACRSIIKYVPWVRKIFIIMPNEKVRYFKPIEEIKDKFVYVKDKDLIGFDSANSAIFQFNLFRLAKYNISENFIYMDDDYFFGKELKKSDFFYYDENIKKVVPFVIASDYKEIDLNETNNLYNKIFERRKELDPHTFVGWKLSILASEKLLLDNFDIRPMVTTMFTHVAIPLNIHDIEECYDLILRRYKYLEETLYSINRHILILQSEHLFVLYGLNIKKRKVHFIWFNYINLNEIKLEYLYAPLYVINTDGNSIYTQEHYENELKLLSQRYPDKTIYELPDDISNDSNSSQKNSNSEKSNNENEQQKKKKKIKNEIINFNLTDNEYYMETVYEQKKKDLKIKYLNKIAAYKKSNWNLFLLLIFLLILLVIMIYYSKSRK